jgi:CBS domain containing-hemolysin-like protein
LIAANGVFVAAEFALVAVDRSRIDLDAEAGGRRARMVRSLLRRLSFHLSGAQLGITVTSLVVGFVAEPTIAAVLEPPLPAGAALLVAFALATIVQMVLGELAPKGLAIARPEGTSLFLAPFLRLYGLVAGPLIHVLDGSANWTVRRLGLEPREELSDVRSLAELELVIEASAEHGTLPGSASNLLTRSIRFGRKTAADALIPRTRVEALASDATATDLVARSATTGFSRFPVYGADLDDIVGLVLVKSVHRVPHEARGSTTVAELMSDVLAVPETRELEDLLFDMRDRRQHLVVVVDEYGGTAGIATLEDLVEEIVGEIDDEYDVRVAHLTEAAVGHGERGRLVLDGSLHPDEVGDATGFRPPEGPYETLAGFVLERLGHVPRPGEWVTHDGWRLEVCRMDGRRIAEVALEGPEGPDPQRDPVDPGRAT